MTDIAIDVFWRSIIIAGFFVVAAGVAWLLYKVIPDGRVKVFLFRVRDEGDKVIFVGWLIATAVVFGGIWWWGSYLELI